MKKTMFLFLAMMLSIASFAQIKGKVVDASTKEVLVGATVNDVATALDGSFVLKTAKAGDKLKVSFVGYKDVEVVAKDAIVIELQSTSLNLKEVALVASLGIDRKTPVAVSTVGTKFAAENLGSQELPELLKSTPSAFITKAGGGLGDSRINIRGFDQKNVAILINGVPVNDMENGWVYFSNWAGIGDALKQIQVQRGLGASKLAIASVGGTMNIITKTTDAEKGGSIQQTLTDYGQTKTVVSYSTGNTKNGAFSFVGSTTQGNGYINGTWAKAYSYFASWAKNYGNHKLQVTLLGAPQQHGQRSSRLTPTEFATYGVRYNKDLYVLNGEEKNININYFHKPIFSINDYWTVGKKTTVSTALYASLGHGGGSGAIGSYSSAIKRDAFGRLAFDSQFVINRLSTTGTKYGLRNSVNNHTWFGILSTVNHKLNDNIDITWGIDGRTYKGTHFREMRTLLGGQYYADPFAPNATVDANSTSYLDVFKVTNVYNRIAYDNDGLVDYYGTFGQVEYSKNKLSAFIQGSVSKTNYGRVDRWNVTHMPYESERVKLDGYNLKAGANYNLTEKHNVFVNAGKYSRAPYFGFIFNGTTTTTNVTSGNAVNRPINNEETQALEAGYGFRSKLVRFKVNAYYTKFKNRSLTSPLLTNANGTQYRALITGQGALHKGIEFEASVRPFKKLDVNAFASFGDWKWKGNASAVIRDEVLNVDRTVNVYSDGLFVGDQPQKQFGGNARYQLLKKLDIGATYTHNAKYYAYYDPSSRTNAAVTVQPYKLPDFGVTDVRAGYKCKLAKKDAYAQIHVYNVFNKDYWVEANDAGGTAAGTLGSGFKGWGRNGAVSLKLNF